VETKQVETKQLDSGSGFPAAVAPAAEQLSRAITDLGKTSGMGFGFSINQAKDQARVLRVLADDIENGNAIVQAVTFEELTTINDFVMFRWGVKFAQCTNEEKRREREALHKDKGGPK
jgi:hypothetical protein